MSAEFTAKRAREFTNNNEGLSSEMWYAEFKDKLFERITSAALDGEDSISLGSFEWNNNAHKKQYLTTRLEKLGYYITVSGSMIISW